MNTIQRFHGILPRLPGVNSHVLTVGAPDFPLGYGISVDFNTIGAAMEAIPLFDPDLLPSDPNWHNPVEQWTILVTPGYYPEVLRFKPFVNVVGFQKEAVIIAGQFADVGPLGAQVYLCSNSLLSNVTLAIRGDSVQGDFAVRGYDVNTYPSGQHGGDVHFLGLSDVDFFPTRPSLPRATVSRWAGACSSLMGRGGRSSSEMSVATTKLRKASASSSTVNSKMLTATS